MDSVEEDEEMCPEQIDEEIIPSTWQGPFFGQRQISLPAAASSGIATPSFASLASTGLQSLFGGCHELKQHHPNHEPMFLVYVGVSKSTWIFEGATMDPIAGTSQVYAWRYFGFYSRFTCALMSFYC